MMPGFLFGLSPFLGNDIALLHLEKMISFNGYVEAALLPDVSKELIREQ
jgi:hypothetical protein